MSWVGTLKKYAFDVFHTYAAGGTEALSREDRNAVFFLATVLPLTVASFLGWMVFYLIYDAGTYWPPALVSGFYSTSLFIPALAKRNRLAGEVCGIVLSCATFAALCYMLGAEADLHVSLLLVAIFGVVAAGTKRPLVIAFAVGLPLPLYIALPLWFPEPQLITDAPPELLASLSQFNIWSVLAVLLVCIVIVLRRAEMAEDQLVQAFDRSEALLANLLPEEIARRLKQAPGEIIADEIPSVTFLFADIVDFTPRVARMDPEELIAFLNLVFSHFDRLAAKYGLEKIKTVGDAYMIAGGLPAPRPDHARAVALMALEMQAVALKLSQELDEELVLRIGMHTGSAIAGVIGTRKVFYDAWGDTVNVAARMESCADPRSIQITRETRDALREEFRCAPRGLVDIKGKGMTETFWLVGLA